MKKVLGIVATAIIFAACSNNASTEAEPVDTASALPQEAEATSAFNLQASFPQYARFLAQQDSSFSATDFEQWATDTLPASTAQPLEEGRLQPFLPYLVYSSDSSQAIDFHSYNYIAVQKSGKTVLEEAGPDTEVALVNFREKTRRRIFFSGPGATVAAAKWLDSTTVLLAGAEETAQDAIKPLAWRINLQERTRQTYRYTDTLRATISSFGPQGGSSGMEQ